MSILHKLSNIRLRYSLSFLIIILSCITFSTTKIVIESDSYIFILLVILRTSLLLSILLILLYGFYKLTGTKAGMRQNLLISLFTFLILFYSAELIFSFIPYCGNTTTAYTSRLWFHYYWNKNNDGFRDIDFQQMNQSNKKRIYFIGDSFTAGHGFKNTKNRTSDVTREKLKNKYNYNVYNMGRNGANTKDEIDILFSAPLQPDIVVLTHINNDVDYLYEKYNFRDNFFDDFKEIKILREGELFQRASEYSFLINYVYNTIHQTYLKYSIREYSVLKMIKMAKSIRNVTLTKGDILNRSHKFMSLVNNKDTAISNSSILMQDQLLQNPTAFNDHINTLCQLDSILKSKSCKLIILIYPDLGDDNIDFSTMNNKMCDKLNSKNITTINLYPLCKRLPQSRRIVNKMNFHASEELNKMVADSLMVHLIPLL